MDILEMKLEVWSDIKFEIWTDIEYIARPGLWNLLYTREITKFMSNKKLQRVGVDIPEENGNHKIAVRLYVPNYDEKKAMREIYTYCSQYTKKQGIRGKYVAFKNY